MSTLRTDRWRPHAIVFLPIAIVGIGLAFASYSAALIFILSGFFAWFLAPYTAIALRWLRRNVAAFYQKVVRHRFRQLAIAGMALLVLLSLFLWFQPQQSLLIDTGEESAEVNGDESALEGAFPDFAEDIFFYLDQWPTNEFSNLPDIPTRLTSQDSKKYLVTIEPTASNVRSFSVQKEVFFNPFDLYINQVWQLLKIYHSGQADYTTTVTIWQDTLQKDGMLKQLEPNLQADTIEFLETTLSNPRYRIVSNYLRTPTLFQLIKTASVHDPDLIEILDTLDPDSEIAYLLNLPASQETLWALSQPEIEHVIPFAHDRAVTGTAMLYHDKREVFDREKAAIAADARANQNLAGLAKPRWFSLQDGSAHVESQERGLWLREAHLSPLPNDLPFDASCKWFSDCPETAIKLRGMPKRSFYLALGARPDDPVPDDPAGRTETIAWTAEYLDDEIRFSYLSPPYHHFRPAIDPFLDISYRNNVVISLFGICGMLLIGGGIKIAHGALEDVVSAWFKARIKSLGHRLTKVTKRLRS